MCGITGFVDFNKKLSAQHLHAACNTLKHRGPDDEGFVTIDSSFATIGLAHRRLSVLDLSPSGHQPMYSDDRKIVIILNGEIYNFKEIRQELEQKGFSFSTRSDAEVIIKAYQQFGMDCLQQFIGMFSLVIYDEQKQKVFLVRDRPGVKPLYYYCKDDCILFASELKAFHQFPDFKKEINHSALSLYFKYGYIKAPYCIFKDTYKLLPGHYAEIDLNNKNLQLHQYWNVLDYYNKPTIDINEKEAIKHLEDLCISAFKYRMVSDVPVGIFLSGGYDSSLVAAILQKNAADKIKTFTIGFKENKFNEAHYAKQVAEYIGTEHYEYYCTNEDATEIIPELPFFYDEPFGDSSSIPTILVSRLAKKHVTVALSADGADEIFAGYNSYDQLMRGNKIKNELPEFAKKGMSYLLNLSHHQKHKKIAAILLMNNIILENDLLSRYFLNSECNELIKNYDKADDINLVDAKQLPLKNSTINALLAVDYQIYMADDILVKVDRASMSMGLEAREPLLDHRIVEWVAQMPLSFKYNNGKKKYLFKQLANQYLPGKMMHRPKMGFGIPLEKWMKEDFKKIIQQTLDNQSLQKHGLFDEKYVADSLTHFFSGKRNNSRQIWLIFMFQLWWKKWME